MEGGFLLTFAAEGILTKVSSLAAQELSLAWGFKSELKKLGKSLSVIQDYLRGVADRKPGEQSKGVEDWVKELKDIAHYADDVLDEFNYEILRRKAELQNHMKRKVINFLSASNPLLFRFKMAHKVKKINDSLIKLKNEAGFINLIAKRRDSRSGGERSNRDQTDSYFEKDEQVIGREDIVTDIVKTLVSSENQQNLSIMAIVGMPGLGKTTLAKSVYHNPEVGTHFNKKIWVCVSNTFEVVTILNQMVDSLTPGKGGIQSQDALLKVLRKELTGKRYVLVLDDVWNEDRMKWESLMSCLSKLSSNEGSSIIITTRSAYVASIAETLPRPELKILSDDKCWSILKQRVQNQNEDGFIDVDREQIGRAIAKKCGGIPLVAKVLGGIMRSKISKAEWMSIQESEIWKLPEEEDRIMPVLKLSFDNLNSPSLKQCFAYCSLLRKDFEIERDDLIQLWMAQGLLQPSTDEIHYEMEDIGNQYFNVLLGNSLLQEVIDDVTITKYTMHDLVHDLAEEVSRCDRDSNVTREFRHVAHLPISTLSCMSETVGRLRALFSNDHVPPEIFSEFRALRVFSLREATTDELPDSFGKLKHLRYLDISNTRIKALPKSIGKLYNLQTLRLQNRFLKEIPREIQNLTNLRHLYFNKDVKVPAGMFRGLKNLRTLSNFNVGKEMGLGIEELGGLNQLQGKLAIRNMENVRDEEEANKAKLEDKKNLLGLSFLWTENRNGADGLESNTSDNVKDESVLERLQPHTKLESLEIENFLGSKFPSWMMRNPLPLYNLKNLILSGCLNCEELPVLGHLPSLKHVRVYKMDNLERLGSEFYGHNHAHEAARGKSTTTILFPALKTLRIESCVKLTEWMEAPTPMTSEVTVFPRLEELSLTGCPVLRNAPSRFPSLREMWIRECQGLSSIGVPTSLQVLTILDCGSLTSIPSIPISKGLPSLRELTIRDCDGLASLPSGIENCTSLQILVIYRCGSLTSIPISKGLPSLRKLRIWNCGGLASLPSGIENCTSLQILDIDRCGSLTSIPISKGLPSLRELRIDHCDGLASLPSGIENCTSLQILEIYSCGSLTSIPISKGLPSLRELTIRYCDGLSGLPDLHYCPSLQDLSVGYCGKLKSLTTGLRFLDCLEKLKLGPFWEELDTFPDFQVPSQQLVSLELNGWPKLKSVPQPIIHFTSVEEMTIGDFNGVEALPEWLGNLTSVRKLHVLDCENVKYLPSLKAMRGLTKLETLRIARCPLLEEWPKISHVPNIDLGSDPRRSTPS